MSNTVDHRELISKALAGLVGGAIGWIPVEITSHGRRLTEAQTTTSQIEGVISMALLAGAIGGLIVAAEGRQFEWSPHIRRRFLRGFVICLLIGIPAVYYSNVVFNAILTFGGWGTNQAGSDFYLVLARVIGWTLMGVMAGAGVGIASGSLPNILKGAIGGWVGGFIGGIAFDIIGMNSSGLASRLFGLCALGLAIGLFIGLVQELTKAAWVDVEAGRLRGRSFRIDRSVATIGRAEESAIGLFGDPHIAPRHAVIEQHGNAYMLKTIALNEGVLVNGARVETAELHDGDRIKAGDYELSFHIRQVAGARGASSGASNRAAPPTTHAAPPRTPASASPAASASPTAGAAASAAPAANSAPCLIDGAGQRVVLRFDTPTTLGRGLDNDVVIADASVSRHHATIERRNDGFALRDLGSSNGTWVGGERITEAHLTDGDSVRFGDVALTFHG